MLTQTLTDLLKAQFPNAPIDAEANGELQVGCFPDWDSVGHFGFLISVEEHFSVYFSVEQMADLKSLKDIEKTLMDLGVKAS